MVTKTLEQTKIIIIIKEESTQSRKNVTSHFQNGIDLPNSE